MHGERNSPGPLFQGYGPSFYGDGQSRKKVGFGLTKLKCERDCTVATIEMKESPYNYRPGCNLQ